MWLIFLIIGMFIGMLFGLFLGGSGRINKEEDAYMEGFIEGKEYSEKKNKK